MYESLPIAEFCEKFEIKKTDLSKAVGIEKQQLNGWINAKPSYCVEFKSGSDEIKIVKPSKVMKEGRIHGFDNIAAELPKAEKETEKTPETPPPEVKETPEKSGYTNEEIAGMSWIEKKKAGLL